MRIARETRSRATIDDDEFLGQAASFTRERPGDHHRLTWIGAAPRKACELFGRPPSRPRQRAQSNPPARRCRRPAGADRPESGLRRRARTAPAGVLAAVQRPQRQCGLPDPRAADRPRRLRRLAGGRVLGRGPAAPLRAGGGVAAPRHRAGRRQRARAGQHRQRRCPAHPRGARDRPRRAAGAGRQRPAAARPGLPHLDRPDRQHAVLDGRRAVGADGVDAAGHLAPHAPARADAKRAGVGDELPARDGELHAHRHARDGHGRPHHLRQPGVLRDDRLPRVGADRSPATLPVLAAGSFRGEQPPAAAGASGPQPGRRHRGEGDAQGGLGVRLAHVRLAADRPEGPADRLDDLDDQHHRGQAHPRPALRLARALHHRARRAGRGGVGAVGAAVGAAVRQSLLPAVVRRRRARPCAAGRRRIARPSRQRTATTVDDARRPAHAGAHRGRRRPARGVHRAAAEVVRRARALPAVDRRPPGADADRHRHHRALQRRGCRPRSRPRRRRSRAGW